VPSAAQALLVVTLVYSLNFYIQQAIGKSDLREGLPYLGAVGLTIIVLFGYGPWFAARYMRVDPARTFRLAAPDPRGLLAAACFGCSTWILALRWNEIQQRLLPMDSKVVQMLEQQTAWMWDVNPLLLVFFLALVPALCEELFFRGYALSGLRASLGKVGAAVVVAVAFGMAHYSAQRLVVTTALGLLLGLLVVQYRSIWPAVILHFTHNAITITAHHPDGLKPVLTSLGFLRDQEAAVVPGAWVIGAGLLVAVGVLICIAWPAGAPPAHVAQPQTQASR
jgi:membrane protease YdiL (CAAX protease family)